MKKHKMDFESQIKSVDYEINKRMGGLASYHDFKITYPELAEIMGFDEGELKREIAVLRLKKKRLFKEKMQMLDYLDSKNDLF